MYKCKFPDCDFISESKRSFLYHIKNHHEISTEKYFSKFDNHEKSKCLYCKNQVSWNERKLRFNETCNDRSCRGKYAKSKSDLSIKEKYGVNNVFSLNAIMEKSRKTKTEKYGDPNYNNSQKNAETCMRKYGVNNGAKTNDVRNLLADKYYNHNNLDRMEKIKFAFQENYGVNWNTQDPSIAIKAGKALSESKYHAFVDKLTEHGLEIIRAGKTMDLKCKKCNNEMIDIKRPFINFTLRQGKTPCNICFPYDNYRSHAEKEIGDFIASIYNGEILFNKKHLGVDVDIILPEEKIAIEYNGIYWHSEFFKPKSHHRDKKILLSDKGYNLIHIWEDDWKNPTKKKIIQSRLSSLLGISNKIYGRKCVIKEIKAREARDFINVNHLMGYASSSIKIGLFYEDELISVSTFGKSRNSIGKNEGFELIRNCTKIGNNVLGGFSKMMKYFINNYSDDIFSYADTDWTNLNKSVYSENGFSLVRHTTPGYFWVIGGKRKHRVGFQKHKLVKKGANPILSEAEIMHGEGYYRLFDSGNLKFIHTKKESS